MLILDAFFFLLQNLKCHSKTANDFVFVGSSSLLATAGNSSDNCNVCIWDTLMPQRSSLIKCTTLQQYNEYILYH